MPTTQYIGSRYVPLLADPVEWSSTKEYEPLTIVTHEGNSYTSRQFVPKVIDIGNTDYWALTGNYNAQIEQYRRDVASLEESMNEQFNAVDTDISNLNTVLNKKVFGFATVAQMANNANLAIGDIVQTAGFYNENDGGGGVYIIGNNASNDMDIIPCANSLTASLIIFESVDLKTLGIKQNEDCYKYINRAQTICKNVIIPEGTYKLSQTVNVLSNRNICGAIESNDYNYGTVIDTTGLSITAFKINVNNVNIKNMNIVHSYNQNADTPIFDFSACKYCNFENIYITKDDNSETSDCIAFYCNPAGSAWSGYITLKHVKAGNYKNCLYAKATLLTAYDCIFNNTPQTENLHLVGEIFTFIGCDISGRGTAFTYDGQYGAKFIGCYFEGFYLPFYTAEKGDIVFESCKYYIAAPTNYLQNTFATKDEMCATGLRNYNNGFHSVSNDILNGTFKSNLLRWSIIGTGVNVQQCDLAGFDKCMHISLDGAAKRIYQTFSPLVHGIYTLSMWMRINFASNSSGYFDTYLATQGPGNFESLRALTRINNTLSVKLNEWVKVYATIDVDRNDLRVLLFLTNMTNGSIDITGINLHYGVYSEDDVFGNSANEEHVLTNNLIVKGSDDVYYKIDISNGVLTPQQIQ